MLFYTVRFSFQINILSDTCFNFKFMFLFQGGHKYGSGGIAFREHDSPQDLAYQGWDYRSNKNAEDIKAGDA